MNLLSEAMTWYPYVVHPITVLGVGMLLLIHHEWALQDAGRPVLYRRVAGFVGAGVLGVLPTAAFFAFTGEGVFQATRGNRWEMDALVAGGILIAAGVTWWLWHRYEWGSAVPGATVALAAVTVPYALLSPFWNVSGHVIVSLMPTLYLTLVARKFWPLLVLPAIMVPNRVYLEAHTWAQTIAGLVLTLVVVAGVYYLYSGGSFRPVGRSASG